MAVHLAVCEIFSAKELCDLENRVTVRSRPLEMAPFDRSPTSSYFPCIVTMTVSLSSKNGLTLKCGFGVVQDHRKRRGSIDHV